MNKVMGREINLLLCEGLLMCRSLLKGSFRPVETVYLNLCTIQVVSL